MFNTVLLGNMIRLPLQLAYLATKFLDISKSLPIQLFPEEEKISKIDKKKLTNGKKQDLNRLKGQVFVIYEISMLGFIVTKEKAGEEHIKANSIIVRC